MTSALDRQYRALSARAPGEAGPGALAVLDVARRALEERHAAGCCPLVELADLWAESLQEGRGLFNKPEKLWGPTAPEETLDLIGQTTIGPWQMTDWNIRDHYGAPYGVRKEWDLKALAAFCREHPDVQAKMIADYIQEAYAAYGRRSPYGIQRYFWLEAYVKGEIGQGAWDDPVLVMPDAEGRREVTPEAMRRTGFYAKQVLLGHAHNPHGLLHWLWACGEEAGVREALETWRDQRRRRWDGSAGAAVATDEPGGFAVGPGDVKFCSCHPEFRAALSDAVRAVLE